MSNKPLNQPSEAIQQQRRNLIKASAAAPFIACLVPNAAVAMSSVTCQGGNFENKTLDSNGNSLYGDSAVRIKVASWGDLPENTQIYRLPAGYVPDQGNLADTITEGETLWRCSDSDINGDSFVVHVEDIATEASPTATPVGFPEGYPYYHEAYVLVLYSVASDGTISWLGYFPQYQQSETVTALTGSCMASIALSDNQVQI